MQNRSEQLDLIRQMVRGDHEAYRQRCEDLDAKGWEGVGLVVGAAFYLAVEDGLTASSASDTIRFVADVRADAASNGFDLDAKTAEDLVAAAKTGQTEAIDQLPSNVVVEAELLMTWKLLESKSADDLEVFLTRTSGLADKWQSED